MATYKSPVDGTLLLPVKNADGDTVYRDKGTGVEYTEEYLKENGFERSGGKPATAKAKGKGRGKKAKTEEEETPPADEGSDEGNEEETPPADEPEA